jgi:hypothetical protein
MKQKCTSCNSCGMPLESKADFALGNTASTFCRYCVDEGGKLLPYDVILKNNAHYYTESQGLTQQAANKMASDLLKTMPAWKSVGA